MLKNKIAKMTRGTPLPSPPLPSPPLPSPPLPSPPLPLPSHPLPSPPLPSLPSLPLVTHRIHSPFQPKQSPSIKEYILLLVVISVSERSRQPHTRHRWQPDIETHLRRPTCRTKLKGLNWHYVDYYCNSMTFIVIEHCTKFNVSHAQHFLVLT